MSQSELLRRVVAGLSDAGIDHMITGSVASSLQGEPRATHDIDLVVAIPDPAHALFDSLARAFPAPEFYLDEEAVRRAIVSRTMFNLIDTKRGDRVDFWMLTDEPFDRSRFERRYDEQFEGMKLKLSRPADTILMKLRWSAATGGSQKQYIDALRVYEMQHRHLDREYLAYWARVLDVGEALEELRRDAKPF